MAMQHGWGRTASKHRLNLGPIQCAVLRGETPVAADSPKEESPHVLWSGHRAELRHLRCLLPGPGRPGFGCEAWPPRCASGLAGAGLRLAMALARCRVAACSFLMLMLMAPPSSASPAGGMPAKPSSSCSCCCGGGMPPAAACVDAWRGDSDGDGGDDVDGGKAECDEPSAFLRAALGAMNPPLPSPELLLPPPLAASCCC